MVKIGNIGWVNDSVTRQSHDEWWIALLPIHPTKDKKRLT